MFVAGFLFICLLNTASVRADSTVDTLVRGNQLYEQGNFEAATQLYEQLVSQGVRDPALYYNLGNAYYKQGSVGQALLNYTRAARLAPRDPDVRANLALARSQVVDKYESGTVSPLDGLLTFVQYWLTLDELAGLALLLWALCALLWLIYMRLTTDTLRTFLRSALLVSALFLAGSALSLGGILYTEQRWPPAIVLSSELPVVSGPGSQYATEFTLHAGAQVSLLERRGDWVRIALPGEQFQGWAPASTVADVIVR